MAEFFTLQNLNLVVVTFVIGSIIGWIFESTYMSIRHWKQYHRHINTGFLLGPWQPVYGCMAVLAVPILTPLLGHPILLYLAAASIATLIELITATLLEKLFNLKWWDYTYYKFDYKGKIALLPSLAWGGLATLFFYFVYPAIQHWAEFSYQHWGIWLSAVLVLLFLVDTITSVARLRQFKKAMKIAKNDANVSEIDHVAYQKYALEQLQTRWIKPTAKKLQKLRKNFGR